MNPFLIFMAILATSVGYANSDFTEKEMADARAVALKWHNIVRVWHRMEAMELDETLNKGAQKYAEHLVTIGYLDHSKQDARKDLGENLASASNSGGIKPVHETEMSVKRWYVERCDPKYGMEKFSHFSQVIWKDSKKLGIGLAQTADKKKIYVVGRYSPQGNMMINGKMDPPLPLPRCNDKTFCEKVKGAMISSVDDCPDGSSPLESQLVTLLLGLTFLSFVNSLM